MNGFDFILFFFDRIYRIYWIFYSLFLDAFERAELKSVPNVVQEIEEARQAARNTSNKTKRVNLRLTERDFHLAHIKALEEGLPYQTLLSSVIHKYLTGRLIDKT